MKILSFDTSSARLTAAVYDGPKKIAAHESLESVRHSDALAPVLQALLKKARLSSQKIDCIAVGTGPGSFTGIRVALTTAKLLAYALKTKIVGVSSLEAAVRAQKNDGDYAVMLDARRSQVYAAVYRRKSGLWSVLRKPAIFTREDFLKSLTPSMMVLDTPLPEASSIAEAALERIREKKTDSVFALEPLYLRPKDCNVSKPVKK